MQTTSSPGRIPYGGRADKGEGAMSFGTILIIVVILMPPGHI
jgi:hypothetical protein